MPIAAQINGWLYAIDADHLNTPRRLTNTQGQVAWQWLITGFGEANPTTGATGYAQSGQGSAAYAEAVKFDLRYPGQVFDEETGLNYNLNRYYDQASGRYIQADPIGLDGGWNRFGYVGQNPMSFVDPRGLKMYPDEFIGPLPGNGYHKSQMTKTRCGLVPPSPPSVDISHNLSVAKGQINPLWFKNMVKNKGPWDYKQHGSIYQDFGNFQLRSDWQIPGFLPPDASARGWSCAASGWDFAC